MQQFTPSVAGFRGVRAEILLALKKAQPLTAKDLATRFDLTPNALRRHLKELEESGLVRHRREVRGVGGPRYAYVLTEHGEELFPRAYAPVLIDAIEAVREERGMAGVVNVFEHHWAGVTRGAEAALAPLPEGERAQLLAELLSSRGYMAEWAGCGAGGTLTEHNCAIRAVAERFPEVCAAEARFLEKVLGGAVKRQLHILAGSNACEYNVRFGRSGT